MSDTGYHYPTLNKFGYRIISFRFSTLSQLLAGSHEVDKASYARASPPRAIMWARPHTRFTLARRS